MKSAVSLLIGVVAGWFLTESDDLMPDTFTNWVGNSVAGSDAVSAVLEFLPLSSEIAHTVHVWIIVASVVAIPVFAISVVATGVYLWSRKARLIVYGSLIVPLFMTATAIYYKYRLAEYDPRLARSFWSNAEGNVQSYLLSGCLFCLAFVAIKQAIGGANSAKSHNKLL